jgi:Zn-dependent protease
MFPSGTVVVAWVLFLYVLLFGIRYLLGARVYLTCALRDVEVRPVPGQQVEPGELRLLTLLDDELAAAGFRHLGFAQATPFMTYHTGPLKFSVFVNERLPAYALVRQHAAPEYGNLVELEIETTFASGQRLVTLNTLFSQPFFPSNLLVEAYQGLSVSGMVERHAARVGAKRVDAPVEHRTIENELSLIAASVAELRKQFRARNWVVPTIDPALDRFTLRGAFALTHYSRRVFGARKTTSEKSSSGPSENERLLRVEADLRAVLRVADNPEPAPGTPWPLLTVIGASGLLSFIAMALLWNVFIAAVILAAITFHEAGHALAMRRFGYRDVHVFFVPLLGAMTVGRAAATTVRDRLAVLLAGPVPGLWLGVVLLAIDQTYGPVTVLRISAFALLILNGLNLLPFTPLDGGRALESLTRPESVWRLVVHCASAVGLLAVAAFFRDPVIAAIGLFWAVLFPRQLLGHRLRRAVAAGIQDRTDFQGVARVVLETMSTPHFDKWRSVIRQNSARALGRLFSESLATPADRRWGAIAYASAWIPVAAALLLLVRSR